MNEWPVRPAYRSTDPSVIETLADLLAAAGEAVISARRLPEHSHERARRIEACVASIYDQVESLLQELAD